MIRFALLRKCLPQGTDAANGTALPSLLARAKHLRLSALPAAFVDASLALLHKSLSKNDTGVITLPARHRWRYS